MKYAIKMISRGKTFYLCHFYDGYRGKFTPKSCIPSRAFENCKKYPSIKAACEDVRKVDRKRWRSIIVAVSGLEVEK